MTSFFLSVIYIGPLLAHGTLFPAESHTNDTELATKSSPPFHAVLAKAMVRNMVCSSIFCP